MPDATDTSKGLSTNQLAQIFSALFKPIESDEPSIDYSFDDSEP
jgi:hypothetical protein